MLHIFTTDYMKTTHMNKLGRGKKKLFDFQMLILLKHRLYKSLISHDYEFRGVKIY